MLQRTRSVFYTSILLVLRWDHLAGAIFRVRLSDQTWMPALQ